MDYRELLLGLVFEGIRAADPYESIIRNVRVRDSKIVIRDFETTLRRTHVIGFGKSSYRMAEALYELLDDRIVGGVVITPNIEKRLGNIEILKGDHPIPRENTKRSSEILIEYLSNIREEDLVLILISGGGSALFEIPLPGLDLDDLAVTTDMLMRSGADIIELNIVRKHLSSVKGGRLLRYIKSREIYSLIMSDVIGDPISFIASGPTEADETTYNDAINVLRRRGLWDRVPGRVREILVKGSTGLIEESVKPGDEVLRRVKNIIVASNMMSLRAIERKARENNLNTLFLGPYVRGEAREVGRVIASILRSIRLLGEPVRPPVAIVSGGETTVTVRGRGVGGRNQETCLSIMIDIRDLDDIHFACVGSDGIDGISPAAGAIVDSRGYWEALELGLDPVDYLDRNDSYTILKKINRVIETGPTGTNVGDFYVGIVARAT